MKYICNIKDNLNNAEIDKLSKEFNLDSRLVSLLFSRGIDDFQKIKRYLNPSERDINDPFLFEDMQKVVDKINRHLNNKS